ncbi:sensor histidine kinase [Actinocorallia populi]|uniref:sensor histidine kinase n=1 Tax=Actinocorallia populi TaxID=2079200 RepID=UPI0013007CB4|nr:histidine kinase [Actinocorallia populi]
MAPITDVPARWPRPSELPVWAAPPVILFCQIAGVHVIAPYFAPAPRALDVLGYGLLVLGPLVLMGRRRWPVGVLVAVAAATLLYHLCGYPVGPFFLALIAAVLAAMTGGHRRAAWLAVIGVVCCYVAASFLLPDSGLVLIRRPELSLDGGVVAWAFLVPAAAELARNRAERAAEAGRIAREQQRRVAGEERLRIARELHDVLAHNISMINVRAGVALHLMDDDPEQARTALTAIKAASKEALMEMRSVIGVLRQGEQPPTVPTAGLARLDGLVEAARAAGMQVALERTGPVRDLPAGTDLAVFRIIQESLTNITRHARPPASGRLSVRIVLEYEEAAVTVRVDDDGTEPPPPDGGGSGIPGMRERAVALDGEFQAGPRTGGGFRVRARLPLAGGS